MLHDNCWAVRMIAALLLTFVSLTACPVATGRIWWGKPPNWNMKTINKCSFVNFYNIKASTGKQKTHSKHKLRWFSPRYRVATTPGNHRGWSSRGAINLCRKLKSYQCRQVLPSLVLAAGMWTSFCSVLMVDRFHSVVWSQSLWPQ